MAPLRPHSRPRRLLGGLLLLAGLLGAAPLQAQDGDALSTQRRIEAAYLYKFSGYITWPDNAFSTASSPILIGVAGDDGMADTLAGMVEGRNVNGRSIQVRRLHTGDSARGLHLLFVAPGVANADSLIRVAHSDWTLAVTEGEDGLQRGADMSFVLVDDRVRFDVDLATVQQSGLKLSALLLSVAHSVSGDSK